MAEELSIVKPFSVELQWPANPGKGGNLLLDESIARFAIVVGEKSITAYQTEKGDKGSHLTIPTYYFVEWIALNWWSFLYEPRKSDSLIADEDFRSRHWLGAARNGFALPDVTFSPAGETIEIAARSAFLRFAQLAFVETLTAPVAIDRVRSELAAFIEQVLTRLSEKGVKDSEAHNAWKRIKETSKDEEEYCRLIGSMGLSPYVEHPEVDAVLEKVADTLPETMLKDLCEATNIGNFDRVASITEQVSRALSRTKPVSMQELLKAQKPADAAQAAYEWGYHAADVARAALGIKHEDPAGSIAFFEKLKLDPSVDVGSEDLSSSVIAGAVDREDDKMRLSLVGSNLPHRKFSAARSAFLAWSNAEKASRLTTLARTRDQQASRAFAAELLVPKKYLKKRLGERGGEVSSFELDQISAEIGAAPTVLRLQAKNHGYFVAEAA